MEKFIWILLLLSSQAGFGYVLDLPPDRISYLDQLVEQGPKAITDAYVDACEDAIGEDFPEVSCFEELSDEIEHIYYEHGEKKFCTTKPLAGNIRNCKDGSRLGRRSSRKAHYYTYCQKRRIKDKNKFDAFAMLIAGKNGATCFISSNDKVFDGTEALAPEDPKRSGGVMGLFGDDCTQCHSSKQLVLTNYVSQTLSLASTIVKQNSVQKPYSVVWSKELAYLNTRLNEAKIKDNLTRVLSFQPKAYRVPESEGKCLKCHRIGPVDESPDFFQKVLMIELPKNTELKGPTDPEFKCQFTHARVGLDDFSTIERYLDWKDHPMYSNAKSFYECTQNTIPFTAANCEMLVGPISGTSKNCQRIVWRKVVSDPTNDFIVLGSDQLNDTNFCQITFGKGEFLKNPKFVKSESSQCENDWYRKGEISKKQVGKINFQDKWHKLYKIYKTTECQGGFHWSFDGDLSVNHFHLFWEYR